MPNDKNRMRRRLAEMARDRPTSTVPDFPYSILVEVSNLCNHACAFCAYPKMTRPGKKISLQLLRRLLSEAYELGAREAGFYSGAEPFTSPDLEEIIKVSKQVGYTYIYTSTNGALATEARLRACFDNGLDSIKFSINGADRETYKLIHGQDHFDRVVRHLRFASDYRRTAGLDYYIGVSFVVMDNHVASNVATKERLEEVVGPYADEIAFFNTDSENGQMIGLGAMEIEAPCSLPFKRLHISAEGYLRMCCSDYQNYLSLLDLSKTTLKEAWHADIFKEMRQRHLDNKLEGTLCYNCINNANKPIQPIVPALAVKVSENFFEFKKHGT